MDRDDETLDAALEQNGYDPDYTPVDVLMRGPIQMAFDHYGAMAQYNA